jgi:hypothetical protein
MDPIRLIFACFSIFSNTTFSHHSLHIRFKIFAQIRLQIFGLIKKIHVAANIRFRANIRLRFSHTGKYLLQNIRFKANIRKTLSETKGGGATLACG